MPNHGTFPLSPSPSRREKWTAAAWAVIVFLVYVSYLSKAYVFEGLIRALPIETGRYAHLFPGNYLLYGPLGLTFHLLLQSLGLHQPAVISLQIMDSLLGAAGVFVFYLILRRLGGRHVESLIGSALLAFSLGYWLWSTEAEDYMLSTFLLQVNFYFLIRYSQSSRRDPLILGVLQGLAMLGHIVNVMFAPAILWVLFSVDRKTWKIAATRYAAAAAVVVGGAYGVVLVFIQKPASLRDALSWFAGSFGANGSMQSLGSGPTPDKLWAWLKMTVHIFSSTYPVYTTPAAWPLSLALVWSARILLIIFFGIFMVRSRSIWREQSLVASACVLWLAVYACVFTSWQPWTMVYRVSDLVPLSVLLFLTYQDSLRGSLIGRGMGIALVLCLMWGNLGAEIYPRSFASNNPHLARMAFIQSNTAQEDWVTGDSGQDEIYIPYFAQRRPIVVARYQKEPDKLAALLKDLLDHHQTVYVTSRVLESEPWGSFFRHYKLVLKAQDSAGFSLYLIQRSIRGG